MSRIIMAALLFMAGQSAAFAIDCGFGSAPLSVGRFTGTPKTIYCYAFEYNSAFISGGKSLNQLDDMEAIGYVFGAYNAFIAIIDRKVINAPICRYKSVPAILEAIFMVSPDAYPDTHDGGEVYLYTIFTDQGLCSLVNK